jgi:hypothetical protein
MNQKQFIKHFSIGKEISFFKGNQNYSGKVYNVTDYGKVLNAGSKFRDLEESYFRCININLGNSSYDICFDLKYCDIYAFINNQYEPITIDLDYEI